MFIREDVETLASLVRGGVKANFVFTNARSACLNVLTP
jgi:hypothetical protein